jgi:predicted enzyme related to lactoylglutathione lyase
MRNRQGDFIWYELLTSDSDAAEEFYSGVIGWNVRPAGANSTVPTYRMFSAAAAEVGGMMPLPEGAAAAGMRPCWLGYIGVDDVDATTAAIVKDGGAVHMPPSDIPGVGRFAMVSDPQGATFYVMRGAMDAASTAYAPDKPGHCQWNELSTSDQTAALAFYQRHFGWEKGDAMPMGPAGDYQFIDQGGRMHGAIMTQGEGQQRPAWLFYFGVDAIDPAAARVREGGGTITHGPVEVPGGSHIIVATDPQGAVFGLVGPKN